MESPCTKPGLWSQEGPLWLLWPNYRRSLAVKKASVDFLSEVTMGLGLLKYLMIQYLMIFDDIWYLMSISHCCMESSAFNHTAWNPLHSIRIHWAMLHGSLCLHSGSIVLHCMESTAFNQDPLGQAACNPLHSLGMHFTLLHGIQCIQSHCMESTAFNQDPLGHGARKPLHSIGIHCTTLHGIHCIPYDPLGQAACKPPH